MKKAFLTLTAFLMCLVLTALPMAGLAEDEDLSYELANDLPTGIEEEDEELSYELANDLPTGIEEEYDEDLSYELAHDLPTGIEESVYAYVSTANGKGLYMRADTNTNSTIITTIPYGAKVQITGYYSSSWAAVVYGNNNGYCMTRYLSDRKPASGGSSGGSSGSGSSTTTTDLNVMFKNFGATSYTAVVTPSTPTGYVNLRWAPTKSAPTQCIYRSGETLKVLAENGTWSQVYDESTGISGFMMTSFLSRVW